MNAISVPLLHLVTSRRRLSPDARTVRDEMAALEAMLHEAIQAGVDVVHIRERDMDAGPLCGLVSRIVAIASGTATRVVVNERADVAAAANADGVHLPSSGMSAARVRSLGQGWMIGRAIHAREPTANLADVDYVLFGTVFPSESKADAEAVAGVDGLRDLARNTDRPVIAIGGITPRNAARCLGAGAAGVAAIGAFLPPGRAREGMGPRAAVAAFREILRSAAAQPATVHPPLIQ